MNPQRAFEGESLPHLSLQGRDIALAWRSMNSR